MNFFFFFPKEQIDLEERKKLEALDRIHHLFVDRRVYIGKGGSVDTIEESHEEAKTNGTPPEKIEINSDGYAILDSVEEIEDEEPSQKPSLLDRLLKKGRRV